MKKKRKLAALSRRSQNFWKDRVGGFEEKKVENNSIKLLGPDLKSAESLQGF